MTLTTKQYQHLKNDVENNEYLHDNLCTSAGDYVDEIFPRVSDDERDELIGEYIKEFCELYK